jgi:hypothetical protein
MSSSAAQEVGFPNLPESPDTLEVQETTGAVSGKSERLCLPNLADLIDELTVNRIKQVLRPETEREQHQKRSAMLQHDIGLLLRESEMALSSQWISDLISLAQINLHIWTLKDRAQAEPLRYMDHLKLAHQLNGIRNRLKNGMIAAGAGAVDTTAVRRTNCGLDGLLGWELD